MNALNQNGVNPGTQTVLTWDIVRSEMVLDRPIYSRIDWRNADVNHAHVVRGYYDVGYSNGVSYVDPATGTTTSREWGNYQSNSEWTLLSGLIHLYKK